MLNKNKNHELILATYRFRSMHFDLDICLWVMWFFSLSLSFCLNVFLLVTLMMLLTFCYFMAQLNGVRAVAFILLNQRVVWAQKKEEISIFDHFRFRNNWCANYRNNVITLTKSHFPLLWCNFFLGDLFWFCFRRSNLCQPNFNFLCKRTISRLNSNSTLRFVCVVVVVIKYIAHFNMKIAVKKHCTFIFLQKRSVDFLLFLLLKQMRLK